MTPAGRIDARGAAPALGRTSALGQLRAFVRPAARAARAGGAAALLGLAGCALEPAAPPRPAPGASDAAAPKPGPARPPRLPAAAWVESAAAPPPASLPAPTARGPSAPVRVAAGPPEEPAPIVRVGQRTVTTADLGDHVLRYEPETALRALDALAEAALVEQEAVREGVTADPATVRAAVDRAVEERRRGVRLEYGAGAELEDVLRERHGRSLVEFRDDVALAERLRLLRDRLVRLSQMREDGVEIRVLVLPEAEVAAGSVEQVRAGADLTLLARRHGVRPPSAPPPLRRTDVPDAAVREALFAAAPGDVLDPVAFDAEVPGRPGEVRRAWQVFKVVGRWTADPAPWPAIAPRVEASLARAPVTEAEIRRWRAAAETRLSVSGASRASGAKPLAPPPEAR